MANGQLSIMDHDNQADLGWVADVCAEVHASKCHINLNANENSLSETARRFMGTPLEGFYELSELEDVSDDPVVLKGDLMYRNMPALRRLLREGRSRLQRMLKAETVDLRPLSGVHAMECTLLALSEPGQEVWSLSPDSCGHFATRHIVARSGRVSQYLPWKLDDFDVDFDGLRDMQGAPALIFLDQSLCLYPLSIGRLREAFPEAILVYDASHTLGLILGGEWPNPFDWGADVVQGNTHKTFPGPQKALIACRDETLARRLRAALSDGLLSSQHTHHTAALAITALEMSHFARPYAHQVKLNTQMLAHLLRMEGLRVMGSRPPEGHMLLAQPQADIDAYAVCRRLMELGIACNARKLFGEPWLRFGTQEISRRGARGYEILQLAMLISRVARGRKTERAAEMVRKISGKLAEKAFSFDRAGYRLEFDSWKSDVSSASV